MVCADCVLENERLKESYPEFLKQVGKSMNYQVADFMIRIKNAYQARRQVVETEHSKFNKAIAQALLKKGFISSVEEKLVNGKQKLKVSLRYVNRRPILTEVEIVSKPSLRVYKTASELSQDPTRRSKMVFVSTPKGVLSGEEARKNGIGGELLFRVW